MEHLSVHIGPTWEFSNDLCSFWYGKVDKDCLNYYLSTGLVMRDNLSYKNNITKLKFCCRMVLNQ